MKRLVMSCVIALPLLALVSGPAWAEVKTREKTHISLGGMIGKVFNIFGGKSAKEGMVGTTAVKGNRKATMNESNGQAMDRLQKEGPKLQGTPLATTTTVEGVKSKEQMAQQTDSGKSSGGGISGMLARKMAKKDNDGATGRATVFTSEHEVQEVQTSVSAADLEIPAGFKQRSDPVRGKS